MENRTVKKLQKLLSQVESCLREIPQTRNSDTLLMLEVWKQFYDVTPDTPLKVLKGVAKPSSIERARRHIQNTQKKFPPTVWSVAKKRRWLELAWKEALGYFSTKEEQ